MPDADHFTARFTAEVWEHQGAAAWYFVSLPHDVERLGDGSRVCIELALLV